MSSITFNQITKTFNEINYSFTNIVLCAVLFGTKTLRVKKFDAPVLVRVKQPTAPVLTRVAQPVAPTYTRVGR